MLTIVKRYYTPLIGARVFCGLFVILTLFNFMYAWYTRTDVPTPVIAQSARVVNMQALRPGPHSVLFGTYIPLDLSVAAVKPSLLNITVVGVLFAEQAAASQVILRLSDGQERAFHVGEALPFGAVVKRILPTGVLIERDGVLEQLSLPKKEIAK